MYSSHRDSSSFLQVKGTIEDFDTVEKSYVVITGCMVLQFITVSCHFLAPKFDLVPSV